MDNLYCFREGGDTCSEKEILEKKFKERKDLLKGCLIGEEREREMSSLLGTVKCKSAKPTKCDGESSFWNDGNNGEGLFSCRRNSSDDQTTYLHKSSVENCPKFQCHENREWSQWSEEFKTYQGPVKGRFCRNNQECVIMETERRRKNGEIRTDFVEKNC